MDEKVDYRLKILGRYRQGTPRERFNLWFGHPGLRHGFDALDRDRSKYPAAQARPDRVRRGESKGRESSAPATAVGSGRGR